MRVPETTPEVFWASGSPYAWRVLLTLALKGIAPGMPNSPW